MRLVPASRDATLTREGEEALWQAVFTVHPPTAFHGLRPRNLDRLRPNNAANSSRAPSVARNASTLAQRYGLSRTTVAKWRTRTTTNDAPMGPSSPHSTVLTLAEEAMVIEFRRRTLLPLDDVRRSSRNDVLGCLRDSISKLTRSSLHRCLERHGISRLPENLDKGSKWGKSSRRSTTPIWKASKPTSWRSSPPTTSPSTSKRLGGRPPSKPSAMPGQRRPTSSSVTHATLLRDQTPSLRSSRPRT